MNELEHSRRDARVSRRACHMRTAHARVRRGAHVIKNPLLLLCRFYNIYIYIYMYRLYKYQESPCFFYLTSLGFKDLCG